MSILLNLVWRFNAIPIKSPASYTSYLVYINKKMLKLTRRVQRPRTANMLLKNHKAGGLTLFNLKIYYKIIVIKTKWYVKGSVNELTIRTMGQNKELRNTYP